MNKKYISLENIFSQLTIIPPEKKLKKFLEFSWVSFFDNEKDFIALPSVHICGFGGAWFRSHKWEMRIGNSNLTPAQFIEEMQKMKAYWWYMTYLNVSNKTTSEMIDILNKNSHFSTQHMLFINILISWISTSVANEFNSQRDIIHLSRITEARTKIQTDPPYVILNEELLPLFSTIKEIIRWRMRDYDLWTSTWNYLEALHLIHPAAKGTAIIISWSLRNLKKLSAMKNDQWKEIEFRRALENIDNLLIWL